MLKEDLEANLRTPYIYGFELLDLHDYLGQGTALVGILDPFWDSKGYVTPNEWRQFCDETVLLARIESYCIDRAKMLRSASQSRSAILVAHRYSLFAFIGSLSSSQLPSIHTVNMARHLRRPYFSRLFFAEH